MCPPHTTVCVLILLYVCPHTKGAEEYEKMVERIKALSAVVDLFVIAEEGFVGVEALLPLVQVCEGRVRERVEARKREWSFAFLCLFFLSACVSLSSHSVCLSLSRSSLLFTIVAEVK